MISPLELFLATAQQIDCICPCKSVVSSAATTIWIPMPRNHHPSLTPFPPIDASYPTSILLPGPTPDPDVALFLSVSGASWDEMIEMRFMTEW